MNTQTIDRIYLQEKEMATSNNNRWDFKPPNRRCILHQIIINFEKVFQDNLKIVRVTKGKLEHIIFDNKLQSPKSYSQFNLNIMCSNSDTISINVKKEMKRKDIKFELGYFEVV